MNNLQLDLEAIEETRRQAFARYIEPLDEDAIELLKSDFIGTYGRLNRLCNLLLLQPKGLGSGVLDSIQDMKVAMTRVMYYLEQRDRPVLRRNADAIRILAEQHKDDPDALGMAARTLLKEIPIGSET